MFQGPEGPRDTDVIRRSAETGHDAPPGSAAKRAAACPSPRMFRSSDAAPELPAPARKVAKPMSSMSAGHRGCTPAMRFARTGLPEPAAA